MLTKSNSGAVVFSLELRCFSVDYLPTLKTIFENFSSVLSVKLDQSAFLKLLKIISSLSNIFISFSRVKMIGKWSDPRLA